MTVTTDWCQRLVAITGGIGTGKSVVSRILTTMGFDVYDCDSRAKHLMDENPAIIDAIANEVCSDAVKGGRIDRCALAESVFANKTLLSKLNSIVHSAVIADFLTWSSGRHIAFVETAILYTSGMDSIVTEVWNVVAPEQLRIARIELRNPGLSHDQIQKRIESQKCELQPSAPHRCIYPIVNDGVSAILPQVERLLQRD